jgi:hypothetical protein
MQEIAVLDSGMKGQSESQDVAFVSCSAWENLM